MEVQLLCYKGGGAEAAAPSGWGCDSVCLGSCRLSTWCKKRNVRTITGYTVVLHYLNCHYIIITSSVPPPFPLQIACTWDHIRGMCSVSNSYVSSPAVQFRNRLLHAILDLQGVLGMQDLGLLHPVPYKDSHGAITFVMVQYLKVCVSVCV